MIISILALIVCIIGLLMWCVSANPKVSDIGKWMFICGLHATLLLSGGHTVKLF